MKVLSHTTRHHGTQLTNYAANQRLKALHNKLSHAKHKADKRTLAEDALAIYDSIGETRNHFVLNTMLKLCFDADQYSAATSTVWADIEHLHQTEHADRHKILYFVLIKSVSKCKAVSSAQCIAMLQRIAGCEYKLKLTAPFINALMLKCSDDGQSAGGLRLIFSLIQRADIADINDAHSTICKTELITLLARIGEVEVAEAVFASLRDAPKDNVCHGAMMSCFRRNGHPRKAIALYDSLALDDRDEVLHMLALKACINAHDELKGFEIMRNIEHTPSVKNVLIAFHSHFGDVESASKVFSSIHDAQRASVDMNAMMSCWISHDQPRRALSVYRQCAAQTDGVSDVLALKACKNTDDLMGGQRIIAGMKRQSKRPNIFAATMMIDFYGHFKDVVSARACFERIKQQTTASLNAMMGALVNNEASDECIALYHRHHALRDDISHVLGLRACQNSRRFEDGQHIIDAVSKDANHSIELVNTMIDFLGDAGDGQSAITLFALIPDAQRDRTSIGSAMNAMIKHELAADALALYDEYRDTARNDHISQGLALKACKLTSDEQRGRDIIASTPQSQIAWVVIDFHSHFGRVDAAMGVFDALPLQNCDTKTVNTMMSCLVSGHRCGDALEMYERFESVLDDTSRCLALKSCKQLGDWPRGKCIAADCAHGHGHSIELGTTLLDFHGHCGDLEAAWKVFCVMQEQHEAVCMETVNAMMTALCNNECHLRCIELFATHCDGADAQLSPDQVSLNIVFRACGQAKSLAFGRLWHSKLTRKQLSTTEVSPLLISLIWMYSECGELAQCDALFAAHRQSGDAYLWNSMLNAYGRNAEVGRMLELFAAMGATPNGKTYVVLFSALSHAGKVAEAQALWESIEGAAAMKYEREVVSALVDCLARNGRLQQARSLVWEFEARTGSRENEVMWMAVMSGCVKFGDSAVGEQVYNEIFMKRFKDNESYAASAARLMQNLKETCD